VSGPSQLVGAVRCSGPGGGEQCPIDAGAWVHHTSERCATCIRLRAGEERLHGRPLALTSFAAALRATDGGVRARGRSEPPPIVRAARPTDLKEAA
jgi:hypothetical protein